MDKDTLKLVVENLKTLRTTTGSFEEEFGVNSAIDVVNNMLVNAEKKSS